MIPLLLFFGLVSIAVLMSGVGNVVTREIPASQRFAQDQAAIYRAFEYATNNYLVATPGYVGTLTWSALKAQPTTPPGMQRIDLPASWYAVVGSGGVYVLCAIVAPEAIPMIGQTAPYSSKASYGLKVYGRVNNTLSNITPGAASCP